MSRTYHHGWKRQEVLFGENWRWLQNEPKWHRKMFKHRPRRRAVLKCQYEVMRGNLDVLWPLDTRPWVYYW